MALSQTAVDEINAQIEYELRRLRIASSFRRPQILAKIQELRNLLDPQQITATDIADALVTRMREEKSVQPEPTLGAWIDELLGGRR